MFERRFSSAHLILDGTMTDTRSGFCNSQLTSFELNGNLSDGRNVRVQIKSGFPFDTAILCIDGTPVAKKTAL